MNHARKLPIVTLLVITACVLMAVPVKADSVSDWNTRACDLAGPASLDTPTANRMLAIMHTAVYEAVNAITKRYPSSDLKIDAAPGASVDAAVAAAGRTTLLKLIPSKQAEIELAYQAALAAIADEKAKKDGVAVGEKAAAAILTARTDDGFAIVESYRPYTVAGVYVPTPVPAVRIGRS